MQSYIEGYYFQKYGRSKEITDKKNDILNVLRKAYPNSRTAQEIATEYHMSYDTVYSSLNALANNKFIIQIDNRVSKIPSSRSAKDSHAYVFEDLNFALNKKKDLAFQFAPGSFNYNKDFLKMCYEVIGREELDELRIPLLNFSKTIIERIISNLHVESINKIAPNRSKDNICKICGYNHEVRDFIRALLLYVLDDLEISPSFLGFMRERNFIAENTYNELLSLFKEREKEIEQKEEQFTEYLKEEKRIEIHEQETRRKKVEEMMLRVLSIEKDTGLNKVFFTATDIQGAMVLGDIDIAVDIPNALTTDTMIKCRPSVIYDFGNNYIYLDEGVIDVSENRIQLEFAYGTSYIEVIDDNKAFPTLSKFSTKIKNVGDNNYCVIDDVQVMKDPVTIDVFDVRIPKEWGKVPITITFIGDETGVIPLIEEGDRKIYRDNISGDDGELIPVREEEKKYTNILNKLSKGDRIRICGVMTGGHHLIPGLDGNDIMSMSSIARLYITKYSSIVKI